MEEAAGDCTNLHMAYPALVYGFWHVLRANEADDPAPTAHFQLKDGCYDMHDLAILSGGEITEPIQRYYHALERLSDREDLRDHPSRYEACGLTLVKSRGGPVECGVYPEHPPPGSVLDYNRMFHRLSLRVSANSGAQVLKTDLVGGDRGSRLSTFEKKTSEVLAVPVAADQLADVRAAGSEAAIGHLVVNERLECPGQGDVHGDYGTVSPNTTTVSTPSSSSCTPSQ